MRVPKEVVDLEESTVMKVELKQLAEAVAVRLSSVIICKLKR